MERDRVWYGAWFAIGALVGMLVSDLVMREPLRQDNAALRRMITRCDSALVECQDAQYGELEQRLGGQLDSTGAIDDTSTVFRIVPGIEP